MPQPDSLSEIDRAGLKTTAGLLIDHLGGFDVAELVAGRSRSVLHDYTNRHKPGACMPVDVVVRLERAAVASGGRPVMTALLARNAGHLLVPVPCERGEVGRAMADALREVAETAASHMEAMGDGVITDAERADICGHLDAAIALMMRARGGLAGPAMNFASFGRQAAE